MMELTMTPKQVERAERNARIEKQYRELRKAYPDAKVSRICETISQSETSVTSAGIRFILKEKGII